MVSGLINCWRRSSVCIKATKKAADSNPFRDTNDKFRDKDENVYQSPCHDCPSSHPRRICSRYVLGTTEMSSFLKLVSTALAHGQVLAASTWLTVMPLNVRLGNENHREGFLMITHALFYWFLDCKAIST